MRRHLAWILPAAALAVAALAFAQRPREHPEWEYRALLPPEISPARYRQVDQWEVERTAREGWELVGVAPYVYLNEERGPVGRKEVVTQTYPAYYFKRLRAETRR